MVKPRIIMNDDISIFIILARAKRVLRLDGRDIEAENMTNEFLKAINRSVQMNIIEKYVDFDYEA